MTKDSPSLVTDFSAANGRELIEILLFENPIEELLGKSFLCELKIESEKISISKFKYYKSRYKFYDALNKQPMPYLSIVTLNEIRIAFSSELEGLQYCYDIKTKAKIKAHHVNRANGNFNSKLTPKASKEILEVLHQFIEGKINKID